MPTPESLTGRIHPKGTMELQRQLAVEQDGLRTSLESIGLRASDALDWRHHVRARPVAALATAVVTGLVIGAMTSRSGVQHRARPVVSGSAPTSPDAGRRSPMWGRFTAGLAGLLADRAIGLAQEFLDGATTRTRRW